jgi:hypothetical protein
MISKRQRFDIGAGPDATNPAVERREANVPVGT